MLAETLTKYVTAVFVRLDVPPDSAKLVAEALVAADMEGIASHGVMLVPMYVERMLAGSVSKETEARVVHDGGIAVVLDAAHALGQLTSHQSVAIAAERAKHHGVAVVAVKNGFHFGAAGYWARSIAAEGLIGIVMCNTRPLMPAPGGAERVVGNNPLAIAVSEDFVVDMATSASAMGKIRLAEAAGKPIPEGWAADADGRPTTDPRQAIKGMLLPAAGPKGFGLAAALELLCGGLSGGAVGAEVGALYGEPAKPYGCSHLFIAIDPGHFTKNFPTRVKAFAERIRGSRRAPGVERICAPGDLERSLRIANGEYCPVPADVLAKLNDCGAKLGLKGIS
jgi:LDH2 family malate/lactate/ureidoglycolate dehydrogenase